MHLQRPFALVSLAQIVVVLLALGDLEAVRPTAASQFQNALATTPAATSLVSATPGLAPALSGSTVFIILLENHDWSEIKGNPTAPYINKTLLPMASYAEQYFNPPGVHPSEPNYLWLEAGTDFGIRNDEDPRVNHQSTPLHLTALLQKVGISWKSYQEDISGKVCPLTGGGQYAPRHNPFVFFDDLTDNNNSNSTDCIAHNRPYTELSADLASDTVARYNFITPNLCHDMHDCSIEQGDSWLSQAVPEILASSAYKRNGIIIITWDESEHGDVPIGLISLSPLAKGGGYSNNIHYTHSSMLRTLQEVFGVSPLLGDAANAADLSDLFKYSFAGT